MPRFRRTPLALAALVAVTLTLPARADGPSTDKIGKKIEAPALARHKDSITAVVFLSFDCPNSTGYSSALAEMYATYSEKGVRFLGVVAADEDAAVVAGLARENKLPFPVIVDEKWALASALKATTTPEAFVLDARHVLRYRGRIDDGYVGRAKKSLKITSNNLRDALDDVLAGRPVREPATKAIGCLLVSKTPEVTSQEVTYYKHVLPVLQARCQTCHRPGEVGPFSLMTYKQAVRWADDIKAYTQSKDMPPWKPVGGPEYAGDRRMPEKEVDLLAKWVDNGCPAGDPKDAPEPRKFPEGWYLGKPDLVLTVGEDFHVGPSGPDLFRCFVLPTGLTEDQFVTGIEVRPGNPRVVHHTLNFWDTSGKARELESAEKGREKKDTEKDHGPGYSSSMGIGFLPTAGRVGGIGGWAPGQLGRFLPENTGYYLPKGSDIVLQVHYHRTGRPEVDRTQIGLYFAKKKDVKPFQIITVAGRVLYIPANDEKFTVKGSVWASEDCTVHSVMPHMHLIGRKVRVSMTAPGESEQTLVNIDDWDYNWQETYFFKKPLAIKAGTRFDIEAVFDNSDKNPNNPTNPPRAVWFGEQTTNEMLFGFLGATKDGPGRIRTTRDQPVAEKK